MAKEEKKIDEVPAFIDYDGSDEVDIERWTAINFESYWQGCLARKRRISAHPWSIKTKTLAKKLIQEYELEDLKNMINWWTEYVPMDSAPLFELFYTKRYEVYDKSKPKDYSEWDL